MKSRTAINNEYQNLKTELDSISTGTTFNGQNLVDGSYNNDFQAGKSATDVINVDLTTVDASSTGLGLTPAVGGSATALSTPISAQATSAELDTAINNRYCSALKLEHCNRHSQLGERLSIMKLKTHYLLNLRLWMRILENQCLNSEIRKT